jgi:hypothetical protein
VDIPSSSILTDSWTRRLRFGSLIRRPNLQKERNTTVRSRTGARHNSISPNHSSKYLVETAAVILQKRYQSCMTLLLARPIIMVNDFYQNLLRYFFFHEIQRAYLYLQLVLQRWRTPICTHTFQLPIEYRMT